MSKSNKRNSEQSMFVKSSAVSAKSCETPKGLIAQASIKVNSLQPNHALRLYKSAISMLAQMQPSQENISLTVEALQSSAFLLIDENKLEEAKENLEKAIQLSPDIGYEKYMYLAQIYGNSRAVNLYRHGIEIINKSLEAADDNDGLTKNQLKRALSNAYCAIFELYTTDLCDEPEAESLSQEAVQRAAETDNSNPQAWLSTANLLFVKANHDEAKQMLEKCLALYWPRVEHIASVLKSRDNGEVEDDIDAEVEELDLEEISGIPFDAHIQMAQMMIELDMKKRAAEILEAMLEQDDEHLEVLYLLTLVGRELWRDSDPDKLRCYVEITKELCVSNGDAKTAEEMEELLATLPLNKYYDESATEEISPSSGDGEAKSMALM